MHLSSNVVPCLYRQKRDRIFRNSTKKHKVETIQAEKRSTLHLVRMPSTLYKFCFRLLLTSDIRLGTGTTATVSNIHMCA